MRISDAGFSRMMINSMSHSYNDYAKLNQQNITGKRINQISEDPVASIQMTQLDNSKSSVNQYKTNVGRLKGKLKIQEDRLTSIDNQLLSLRDKLIESKNHNNSGTPLAILGREIGMLIEGITDDLNAKDVDGKYLFSGTRNSTKPVEYDTASQTYSYNGNNDSIDTVVGNGITMQGNVDLSAAFSTGSNNLEILTELRQLANKMVDSTIAPASYNQDISTMIGAAQTVTSNMGSTVTELGARQNRLGHLEDINEDLEIVNSQLEDDLIGIDVVAVKMELENSLLSIKTSFSTYAKISQLSLFNYI
ncbi:flagellin N-terminal helical domain-containing protein [Yersinia enterocolitica]|uniref:Flagellar hook-associated protein FlgL n=1 Tax=Yersinia enterocolitica TaxID=630 RepID=A0A9P1PTR9_YEREN|nr:flagellar biosynthesis protein FlgL [Yersinia enterocolitica]EKN3442299.1 flagellar biosynthesis protein FlgL [Yersinia enterocolitica]EKN3458526.1 flagellar biosynthesis protein FlgL [Yersinia enterocolitica]EKN3466540.1 flagellar biosynthesis protein FlgL [Yersinia enterocolitica]EKN3563509.1 flagellar biosynthesis protein FlgL [Yersinia enterocolitica]EKN3570122.1 flagellar biosynthesis protein FlgL [Yersinia enterocolitica]